MATQIKKNETVVLGTHKNGVHLQFLKITFPSSVAALLDTDITNANPRSPVAAALDAIAQVASIELIGVGNGSTEVNIAVAALGGDFVGLAAQLQTLVRATGTNQGIDNNTTNVAALVF